MPKELTWSDQTREEIESRIINLRADQIGALLNLVGLQFHHEDIKEIAEEIKQEQLRSGHLITLITEADSKKNLLWWVEYFEEANKEKNQSY